MLTLPEPRVGNLVFVKNRKLPFSLWPAHSRGLPSRLNPMLFVSNPWALMNKVLTKECPGSAVDEAKALLFQAEFFYKAQANTDIYASKALLTYYGFLNLAKSFALLRNRAVTLDQCRHGLSEKIKHPGSSLITDAYLTANPSPSPRDGKRQMFDELLQTIQGGSGLPTPTDFDITMLLPQIVMGHRLWCEATSKEERFVPIEKIEFFANENGEPLPDGKIPKSLWLRLYIFEDDLTRFGITHERLLSESGLESDWSEVHCAEFTGARQLLCFQQKSVIRYTDGDPLEHVNECIRQIKPHLWTVVTSIPAYRKYYLYLCPPAERDFRLPQVLSSYAIMFYLGSITRYRPHHFKLVIDEIYGAFIQELLTNQPDQILYLLSSEFARQEVTRPAVI